VGVVARRATGYRGHTRRGYLPFVASPTAAYSIRLRVRLDNRPGSLGRLATAVGEAGGNIAAIGGFDVRGPALEEDLVVNCRDADHIEVVRAAVEGLEGCEVLELLDRTFLMHDGGKIEVLARMPVADRDDLSMAYTPGVARVCNAIADEPDRVHDLTWATSAPRRRCR
jgi:malate dehydrogenase (oxaloacetate-decarboxylating)